MIYDILLETIWWVLFNTILIMGIYSVISKIIANETDSYWWSDISVIYCNFCTSYIWADSHHLGLSSAT